MYLTAAPRPPCLMIRRGPVVALCLAALSFGSASTGTKYALGGFEPVGLLAVELALATALLWAAVAVRGFHAPRSLTRVAVLGLFEPALAYLGQTAGLAHTSATNGALIMGLECVFVVVLAAVLLRERITGPVALAIVLALVGLVVLESGSSLTGPGQGDLLVLVGALCAAAYTIVARGLDPGEDPLSVTTLQFTAASAIAVPAAAVAWARGAESVPTGVEPRYVVAAALVGVVGFGGSFLLYNYAIASVEAAPAAVIINLIPPIGLITAVGLLGEPLTVHAATGAGLICGSVAIFGALELVAARRAAPPIARRHTASVEFAPDVVLDLSVLVDDIELPVVAQSVA